MGCINQTNYQSYNQFKNNYTELSYFILINEKTKYFALKLKNYYRYV